MRAKLMKQHNSNDKLLIDKNADDILRVRRYTKKQDVAEEEEMYPYGLEEILYYNLSQLEKEVVYNSSFPIQNVYFEDETPIIEVLWFIGDDSTEDDYLQEEVEFELADFEIGEEEQVIELEEITYPEPAPDPLVEMRAENKALEMRLETIKRQAEDDRKQNEATTLAILELMMSII